MVKGPTGQQDHKWLSLWVRCVLWEVTAGTITSKRGRDSAVWAKPWGEVRLGYGATKKKGRHKMLALLFCLNTCYSKWNLWQYHKLRLKKKKAIGSKIFWGQMLQKRVGLAQSCIKGWCWDMIPASSWSSPSAKSLITWNTFTPAPAAGAWQREEGSFGLLSLSDFSRLMITCAIAQTTRTLHKKNLIFLELPNCCIYPIILRNDIASR